MTLVAAFRIEGIPVLIGDFLITDEQRGIRHLWLPTRPDLNDPRFPELPRRVSDLRRKIHLINDRFAVGFSGDVDAGCIIFADLERRFGKVNTPPSIRAVTGALERFNVQFRPPRRATVIGWICGSRPRCFRWEAKPGSSARRVTGAIEGSGGRHFTGVLTNAVTPGYSPAVKTAFEKSVLLGLAKVGAVLTEELSTATNLQASYGYGAELALFTGRRFELVSKLGYLFWNARIEPNDSVVILPSNVQAVYEARGRYALLAVSHGALVTNERVRADNTYVQPLKPLHDDIPGLTFSRADAPTPECRYYFCGIAVEDKRTTLHFRINFSVIASADAPFRYYERDSLHFFEWDRQMLENMILYAGGMAAKQGRAQNQLPRGRADAV